MRYYSIIDELFSEDPDVPESIIKHHISFKPVDLAWLAQDFGSGDLPLPSVNLGIIFDSTIRAAKIDFSSLVDGFNDIFKFSIIDNFSESPLSAGQKREHFILNSANVGYLLRYSTDPGDNTLFTYKLIGWNNGVETPILTNTITTIKPKFRFYVQLKSSVVSLEMEDQLVLSAPAIAPYNFSKFIIRGSDPGNSDASVLSRIDVRGDTFDPVFIDEYTKLLIKQYYEKTNARSEIEGQAKSWSRIFSIVNEINEQFDVDLARGVFLDILGKIVFGFPPRNIAATGQILLDSEYRQFIKIKIAKNTVDAVMASSGIRPSIQDIIQMVFDGQAFVVDHFDMSMTIYLDSNVDLALPIIANELNLLPKPQGVRYRGFVSYNIDETFGFEDNPNALLWDDKFIVIPNPGLFAEKVF